MSSLFALVAAVLPSSASHPDPTLSSCARIYWHSSLNLAVTVEITLITAGPLRPHLDARGQSHRAGPLDPDHRLRARSAC